MTTAHDVCLQMIAAGLDHPPSPLNLQGAIVRFGPQKAHWYRLREVRSNGGSSVVVGSFGNHKGQQRWRVEVDWRGIGEEERAALEVQRRLHAESEERERNARARRASLSAGELWAQACRSGHSAYLERKQVEPEACRYVEDGSIVIPLIRYDLARGEALKGLQQIWPDGTKRNTYGFRKTGSALRLGQVVEGAPLLICEGYATGLTLRTAVQRELPVFVALDAGNLQPVAELLRRLHPASRLLICADDDYKTKGNPGREKALEVARSVKGASYVYPVFRAGNRGRKDTDFNDLQAREGVACVARQLAHVLPLLGWAERRPCTPLLTA